MPPRVAAFTDTYHPTVNGVTYTVSTWRDRWDARDGRMDVVYPSGDYDPDPHEHPVPSLRFPFYEGYRLGTPRVPGPVREADVVHAHTPFGVGLAGQWLARRSDRPLVASYHTPTAAYADYLVPGRAGTWAVERLCGRYERWFFDRADVVLAPTVETQTHLEEEIGVSTPVTVIQNGVDIERFRPVDATEFRERHDLPTDRPLIGYTGRHGYEKRLRDVVDAADGLDATVVFGGDGPAREDLAERAAAVDADVRFLGFLDRDALPAFYSALDVFAFPSPVETLGLVALEANACGTPVVGADSGALADTVDDGVTGYHFETGDPEALCEALERALQDQDRLSENCVARREGVSVERAVDELAAVYEGLLDE
ncbi:MAG: glycosyltransferase [Halobacteriaceae archaeon]